MIDLTCSLASQLPYSSNAKTQNNFIDTVILEDDDEHNTLMVTLELPKRIPILPTFPLDLKLDGINFVMWILMIEVVLESDDLIEHMFVTHGLLEPILEEEDLSTKEKCKGMHMPKSKII